MSRKIDKNIRKQLPNLKKKEVILNFIGWEIGKCKQISIEHFFFKEMNRRRENKERKKTIKCNTATTVMKINSKTFSFEPSVMKVLVKIFFSLVLYKLN